MKPDTRNKKNIPCFISITGRSNSCWTKFKWILPSQRRTSFVSSVTAPFEKLFFKYIHVKEKILLKAYTLCLGSFNRSSALTAFSSLVILLFLCLSLLQFIGDTIKQCNSKHNLIVPCEEEYASLLFVLCAYAVQNCVSPVYIRY